MWMPDARIETIKYIQENIDYTFPYIRLRDMFGSFKSKWKKNENKHKEQQTEKLLHGKIKMNQNEKISY